MDEKSMNNPCKIDAQKLQKINVEIAPQILENLSKNRSGADLGPLILGFFAFWHDAKRSRFFGTSLEAQKIGKLAQEAARRPLFHSGGSPREQFSGIWAPGAARARPCTKVQKQETRLKGLKAIGKRENWLLETETRLFLGI